LGATLETAHIAAISWTALGLLAGLAAASLYRMQRHRIKERLQAQRRLPQQWPLNPRSLVNSTEHEVWRWLKQTFPDHCIMLKLPLTRLTIPRKLGAAGEWFELLSSAYCTFTICDHQGRVLGCVDVPGPHGISRGNHHLKQTLLMQCGIAYWIITPDSLPETTALRADILGNHDQQLTAQAHFTEAATSLHQTLDRNRQFRHTAPGLIDGGGNLASELQALRRQPDSFLGTLNPASV
jgi:hypothetical protein